MLHSSGATDGWPINVNRTYRIYRWEGLIVRRRRRKKLPVPKRQPLVPAASGRVSSVDFLFDDYQREGLKTLAVAHDCSKEVVSITAATSIPELHVARVLDQVKAERGLTKVLRKDNGLEFTGRTIQH